MKNQVSENRANRFEELVWKYLSATHSVQPNTNMSLKMLGGLLYLAKNKNLRKAYNVSKDDSSLLFYMDRPYIDITAGSLSEYCEKNGIYNIAVCYEMSQKDGLSDIISICVKELRKVGDPIYLFEFADVLIENEMSSDEYLAIYDFAIQQYVTFAGRGFGEIAQPKEMTQLVASLIDKSCDSIYNPFAGVMSYATEIAHYDKYDATEINVDTYELGLLRVALSDHFGEISLMLGDVANWTAKKYDAIVTTPPFRFKMNMVSKIFNSTEYSDTIALRRFEDSTTEKGELFTYVPLSLLFSDNEMDLRRELTSKGWLDTIIILPSGIMYHTNIPTALIVLKKSHSVDDSIRMINASSFFIQNGKKRVLDLGAILEAYGNSSQHNLVSVAEVEDNQWSWNVIVYNTTVEKQHPEGYTQVKFGEIVETPYTERQFEDNNGPVVKISDLSDSPYDYFKSPDAFPASDDLKNTVKCCEPVLLLSTIRTLKPTFCDASRKNPIFVSKNIAIFRLTNPNIDLGYLCCVLADSQIVPSGIIIPNFTRASLLRMNMYFPQTIEEQKNIFLARKQEAKLAKVKELGLQELVDNMKAEYINTVRMRKHDMRPYIRDLGSAERLMRHYISIKDEMEDFSKKMTSLLDNFHVSLSRLSELIDMFSDEDNFGKPEAFNVNRYFNDLKNNHNAEALNYSINYYFDADAFRVYGLRLDKTDSDCQVIVDIAHSDFERIVCNIVENARKHGFTDPDCNNYNIEIDMTINAEKNMIQIDFANNGKPLPKGMDKKRYGLLGEKAGVTGGSGKGGNIVKTIVEHYHGDYDVFMQEDTTVIRILLPISNI